MNELKNEIQGGELFGAIKDSIQDARNVVQQLAHSFQDNVRSLRMDGDDSAFKELTQNIGDLDSLLKYIKELGDGVNCLDGMGLPPDPITAQGFGINLFREMHTAIEVKDWIMLSDLIEYELAPLLGKEDEWLGSLDEKLKT
ncbi:MAG: hypothetical protein C4560_13830 [Nitrospiraceae bacterium]|nr:MAG: hypothetical protein C4560_13830 [Nitrospiraceae bacterium]